MPNYLTIPTIEPHAFSIRTVALQRIYCPPTDLLPSNGSIALQRIYSLVQLLNGVGDFFDLIPATTPSSRRNFCSSV